MTSENNSGKTSLEERLKEFTGRVGGLTLARNTAYDAILNAIDTMLNFYKGDLGVDLEKTKTRVEAYRKLTKNASEMRSYLKDYLTDYISTETNERKLAKAKEELKGLSTLKAEETRKLLGREIKRALPEDIPFHPTWKSIVEFYNEINTAAMHTHKSEKDYYLEGVALYHKGDYVCAKEMFLKSVDKKPREDADDVCYVGDCLRQLGSENWKEALMAYELATEKNPNHSHTWQGMGYIHWELGNRLEALKVWEKPAEQKNRYLLSFLNKFDGSDIAQLQPEEQEQFKKLKSIIQN